MIYFGGYRYDNALTSADWSLESHGWGWESVESLIGREATRNSRVVL